ncbi:MAG TPA: metallophosphoesterase family protein [bacterium]|jgi:serine/threonine protein phosphatase 1
MDAAFKREIAIGDVHGRLDALDAMLEEIKPGENDLLIFLGDYVDRGPESAAVLDRIMKLDSDRGQKDIFLMGNHEDMMLRWLGKIGDRRYSQKWMLVGGRRVVEEFGGEIPEETIGWLTSRLINRYRTKHACFVHAGFWEGDDFYEKTPDFECRWLMDKFLFSGYRYPELVIVGHSPPDRIPGYNGEGPYLNEQRNIMFLDCGCYDTGILAAFDAVKKKVYKVRV